MDAKTIRERLGTKASAVSGLLRSETGAEFLRVLTEQFYDGELMGSTPEATAYNLGRRDVVVYIRQLMAWEDRKER